MAEFDAIAFASALRRDGYTIHEKLLSPNDVDLLGTLLSQIVNRPEVRKKRGVYGIRNLLEICDAVRTLAADARIRQFPTAYLGDKAFAVRAIFFDKVPDANWSLFWHQDKVIAVNERIDVPGFLGWSQKAGVWQVQPPVEILAQMMAVRIHLDDCPANNGPLRVMPGSHRFGWLDDQLDEWKQRGQEVVCTVGCGGVVTMSPLTLHASAASQAVGHRRVIHIEYAAADLPAGLEWNNRIGKLSQSFPP